MLPGAGAAPGSAAYGPAKTRRRRCVTSGPAAGGIICGTIGVGVTAGIGPVIGAAPRRDMSGGGGTACRAVAARHRASIGL